MHGKVINYLEQKEEMKSDEEEKKEVVDDGSHVSDDILAIGKKRLRPMTLNAIKKGEIYNSVEYAFLQRPNSPNFRIYSDKDVNGVQKCQNFIGLKYE